MARDKRLRNITRVDYARKHQHGWWVRIHRDGEMIQKFFSDSACGGESRALREAKTHRDELLRLYPKPERGNMFNRPNSRNTSGIAGVNKTRSLKRGYAYEVWQASWILPDGKQINRRFHFSTDGRSEREAKRLAIKARKEGVETIKRMMEAKNEKRQAYKKTATNKKSATKKKKAVAKKKGRKKI